MLHGSAENFLYDQARPAAIYVAAEEGGRGEWKEYLPWKQRPNYMLILNIQIF